MKKTMLAGTVIALLLTGCGGGSGSSEVNTNTNYLSDSEIEGVHFTCGSDEGYTSSDGAFTYDPSQCATVEFNLGGITLGSIDINSTQSGDTLYPANLLDFNITDTNNSKIARLVQLFQSLDNDANPYNRIYIDKATEQALNGITLDMTGDVSEADLNATLQAIGKSLIRQNDAIAHYEETLRNDLNSTVSTVPPATPILNITDIYTDSLGLLGMSGTKIQVDGNYTGIDINATNEGNINLGNYDWNNPNLHASIALVDELNRTSEPFVYRPDNQTLDARDVQRAKELFEQAVNKRAFQYHPTYNVTGNSFSLTFSQPQEAPATENQSYPVDVNISKGSAHTTVTYTETIPFSQDLRDEEEVQNIKSALIASGDYRSPLNYNQKWPTGDSYTITYSEPKRNPTAIDQRYNVTVTITKGNATDYITYSEFVPTNNVSVDLNNGTQALLTQDYQNAYDVLDAASGQEGKVFYKIGDENSFIGTAMAVDPSLIGANVASSEDLLNQLLSNSSNLNAINVNHNSDGSLIARYEITGNQTQSLYDILNNLLSGINYSVDNLDLSQFPVVSDAIVDFYIEYSSANNAYVLATIVDKNLSADSEIYKVINKDSIVTSNEKIVNEKQQFTMPTVIKKGDFLLIIDDSGSMGSSQSSAIDAVQRTFATATEKYGLDWKATVVGTENGRDYSSYTQSPVENNITQLTDEMSMLGTNGGDERGMKIAYNYLSNGDIVTRTDSSMSVIYLSDEPEHATYNEIGLQNGESLSNSYFVLNDIKYNVILPENLQTKGNLSYDMSLATGGDIANLYNYQSGYDRMMQLAVRYAVAKSSPIKLQYPAIASSINVTVDGQLVNDWEYDSVEQAIVFDATHAPAVGSNVEVTYSHLDYDAIVQNAQQEFNALSDSEKRDYTNKDVEITFDPAQPRAALSDRDQTYPVTVTFSTHGYTRIASFTETVARADFNIVSNADWKQNGTTFTSNNHTNSSTSQLEVQILKDTVIDYSVSSEAGYDYLTIDNNGTRMISESGENNGSINVSNGDTLLIKYTKDGGVSSGSDEAIITIH
ncbi:hypothetical protein LCX93_01460 [Sulfurimonas sp. SWIR-19]|uniref:hypothetical protein n=1 Tax=Sulfurimonas sp. SWIR-19 TaxID=2878390 RepID=UPI001CF4A661|nr:hypothetical protein [Sulfurimonas sp. SWIR-19]UCN00611.1 hypothetical protein LCX93_01460 [Sulfurimonas sp. SWIR-19]